MTFRHNFLKTPGTKPTGTESVENEIVINEGDGTLWTKTSSGDVKQLGGSSTSLYTQVGGLVGKNYVDNISRHVGEILEVADKDNAYQFPDESGEWYGVASGATFPITIPADPEASGDWELVNSVGRGEFDELKRQGIGVWDADTTYPVNGIAKGSNGKIYATIVEQLGNDPVSDDGTNWIDITIYLGTVSTIQAVSEDFNGKVVSSENIIVARGWYGDQEFGGGNFIAEPAFAKSLHDGGIYISPTVPKVSDQPGVTLADRRDNFVNGLGETDPGGNGVFLRLSSDMPQLTWFGGVSLSDTVPVQAAKAAVQSNSNEATTYQWAGNMVIGDRPLPFSASIRDAFQVSRFIDGKTDCHAFADKTVIQSASDAGTYGTFDSQTVVEGSHVQDHQFSFQDRAQYNGSGTLQNWGNIIWPVMNGSGTVDSRTDIEIKDVSGVGGTIDSHIGLYVRDLSRADLNVAINLAQSSGFAVYAPNAGKWEIGGEFKSKSATIAGDTTAISGVPLTWKSDGVSNQKGFLASNDEAATVAVAGDNRLELVTNASSRLIIEDSTNGYAIRPSSSSQDLGTAGTIWNAARVREVIITPQAPGSASNLGLFVDNTDGKLKFKDNGGTIHDLY